MTTRDITARSFRALPATARDEDRSVEFVASTEAPVTVFDSERWEAIDEVLLMSGVEVPAIKQVPLLDSHNRGSVDDVLGAFRDLRVVNGELIGRAVFSQKQKAFEAYRDVKAGLITDVSVGYAVTDSLWIPAGERQVINGREYAGPLKVTRGWDLREVSLVPIGADPNAKSRSQSEPSPAPARQNTQEENNVEELKTVTTATPPAPAPVIDTEAIRAAGILAERERSTEIRSACAVLSTPELADRLIADGVSADEARKAVIAELAKVAKPVVASEPTIRGGATDSEKFVKAATDSIILRALPGRMKGEVAPGAEQMRRMSLESIARECLRRAGVNTAYLGKEEVFRAALSRRSIAAHTTSDFDNILASITTKSAMLGWQNADTTYQMWCRIGSLPDFKAAKRVRLSDAPDLKAVNEAGEVTYGTMSDSGESIALVTYARNLSITRQALLNDDLGLFDTLFRAFGARAANLINSLPYAVLAANANLSDSVGLFSTAATRLNLASSGGAISSTTIAVGAGAMFGQTAPQGSKINLRPRFLLTGAAYMVAAQIATGEFMPDANTPAGTKNPFSVLSPIADANIPGNAWYLTADPSVADTVEVAFLDGMNAPTITEAETSPDILGRTYTAYIDATAKALDFRGLYKNAGA